MTTRRFTANPVVLDEAPTLVLDGRHVSDPEQAWEETFTARRAAPSSVIDMMAGSVSVDSRGRLTGINQAQAIPILREVLDPESARRFDHLIGDPDRVVDLGTLWMAASWLVEQLIGRPTGGPGTSSSGPETTPA